MSNKIKHSGIVEQAADGHVSVRILQTSACASCKVATHCNASEAKEKVVDVYCDNATAYNPGDEVTVTASKDVANRALLMGFGLPLLILIVTLVSLTLAGCDEGNAALASLAMLVPYYLLLWLFRSQIGRHISFSIEP